MIDAVHLDNEIFNVLKAQMEIILQIIPPWILKQHDLKLDILLHYLIWKLSVCKFHSTFGQQLLNMKYPDHKLTPRKQRLILISRIISHLQTNDLPLSSTIISKLSKLVDILFHFLELANLLFFFREGKYPTITDRLLRLRLVCIVNKPRSISYNYMTRELIWYGFLELLTFTMSVVNYQYIRKMFTRLLCKTRKSQSIIGRLVYTIDTKCVVCFKTPVLPQSIGCAHVFCYYCLQTNRLVDSNFECPSCEYFSEATDFVHL